MSEAELVQQALLHKRKLSVERKNREREAEAKRKRAIAKARATKGATPSDIKRVAAARGFVVTDDEVRRMFAVFPAARPRRPSTRSGRFLLPRRLKRGGRAPTPTSRRRTLI